jgi:hypothetical protein
MGMTFDPIAKYAIKIFVNIFHTSLLKRYVISKAVIGFRSGVLRFALLSAAEKLDMVCDYLDFGTVLPVLLPAVLAKLAVNGDRLSLYQILVQRLSLLAPNQNVKEISLVFPPFALAFPPVYSYGKLGYCLPIWDAFQFSVAGKPSNDNYFVNVNHHLPPVLIL